MKVVKEAIYIPDFIQAGLETGEYYRNGSVVRNAENGEIVKHLLSVIVPEDKTGAGSIVQKAGAYVLRHKSVLICVGGVAVLTGGAFLGVKAYKKQKFQKAFTRYMDAIKSDTLTVEIIEDFEKKLVIRKKVTITLEDFLIITNYTKKHLDNCDADVGISTTESNVIDIQRYLELQKRQLQAG